MIGIHWYWLIMIDIDWYWIDWYWLILIDIDWYWLILVDIDLIDIDWYWLILIDIDWYWIDWYWLILNWLILIDIELINIELILIDIDWYWLILNWLILIDIAGSRLTFIEIDWYWLVLIKINLMIFFPFDCDRSRLPTFTYLHVTVLPFHVRVLGEAPQPAWFLIRIAAEVVRGGSVWEVCGCEVGMRVGGLGVPPLTRPSTPRHTDPTDVFRPESRSFAGSRRCMTYVFWNIVGYKRQC